MKPKSSLYPFLLLVSASWGASLGAAETDGDWEITPGSERALEKGLEWLAKNQGADGNWESNDLGLVSLGALAFLAAGHAPGRGEYGDVVKRALDHIARKSKPSGLLNTADSKRDMYNHGLATFVLGQAYGMSDDTRISSILDRALKLIANTQSGDGGWDYHAHRQQRGHDLSLAVMQAKALRSAMDSGLEVPREVVSLAIQSVREHYRPRDGKKRRSERSMQRQPGQFTYDGGRATLAMAAAGVVCLQEFGEYDDWRIAKNMDVIYAEVRKLKRKRKEKDGRLPLQDAYTLYYVSQAIYQASGRYWRDCYPRLRDSLVAGQRRSDNSRFDGSWIAGKYVGGKPGDLFGTAVACFVLAIPNRYLPILQEGRIESFGKK